MAPQELLPPDDPRNGKAEASPPSLEIDGGFVEEIEEPSFDEHKHRALAAQKLALLFAWIFASALALHYVCFMILAIMGRDQSAEALGRIFNVWLPALTGIVSAAATYYFTREH